MKTTPRLGPAPARGALAWCRASVATGAARPPGRRPRSGALRHHSPRSTAVPAPAALQPRVSPPAYPRFMARSPTRSSARPLVYPGRRGCATNDTPIGCLGSVEPIRVAHASGCGRPESASPSCPL